MSSRYPNRNSKLLHCSSRRSKTAVQTPLLMYSEKQFLMQLLHIGVQLCAVLATRTSRKKQKRNMQPTYHRASLHSPLCSTKTTAWKQILLCGNSSDFLIP